ncbi:MDR/zinc-dependent alcohol dehydrogenase-like family protein [Mucilaginibacter robiniae]|uniref:hypothetical protein n=1 Tax=Mucilaginibacter robiniae TaxID=2728022 RepID=UPI002006ED85|nr:hypothetical protein [Mucilaginibacter robiniae]
MKAIVMFQKGGTPQYVTNFPEPGITGDDQLMMTVQAAAIKHLDRSMASGKHYTTEGDLTKAKVIGGDGVGLLEDGTRVFALGVTGTMAEKAVIDKKRMVVLPGGIAPAIAAALPNAVAGSVMALRYRADMQSGDTVLINGARLHWPDWRSGSQIVWCKEDHCYRQERAIAKRPAGTGRRRGHHYPSG